MSLLKSAPLEHATSATEREIQVASLWRQGMTAIEIGRRLNIVPGTVRNHMRNARLKGLPLRRRIPRPRVDGIELLNILLEGKPQVETIAKIAKMLFAADVAADASAIGWAREKISQYIQGGRS